ncbi:MAG: alpha/beta hydrolase [Bacteroidetes bacterium]|nr:alpha/beta hydrolase [Bacteroidota bacterium]MBP7400673.1 lysophospholipase [Chitinophagales bacterium]MBK7109192.1 alpha/beta hydrolase [Bacteroidota bacterium]MBK8488487.1 alpha/beta hydrolase [Bacteroidota bacterium]MBK8681750.1 alpha/beta hydrolase [Bacteroidota bacterium]
MIQHTYEWPHSKQYSIYAKLSEHSDDPYGTIGIIHGQSDHSGRYNHVADFLSAHHYAVMNIDLPGHGKSGGRRGHIDTFQDYIEAADMLVEALQNRHPGKPVYLYGHSMGGNIVLNYLLSGKYQINGCIVTSPWIRLAFEPPKWKRTIGKILRNVFPTLQQPTGLAAELLTHDNAVNTAYKKDPLVHGKISSSAFFEIMEHGEKIINNAQQFSQPIFLAHGDADKITDHTASQELAALRPDIITYNEYEGLYHELHNEPEKQQLFNDIIHWLNQQTQHE